MGCVVGVSSDLEQHRSPPSSSPEHHLSRVLCMVVGGHCGVSDGSFRAIECAAFDWFPSWLAAGVGDHQKQVPRLLMLLVANQVMIRRKDAICLSPLGEHLGGGATH